MNYTKADLIALCNQCIAITKIAGEKILYLYNNSNYLENIKIKADNSPVTMADLVAHDRISDGLNKLLLNNKLFRLPILSEESDDINSVKRLDWGDYWLLDPVDGTKEFIARTGEFCVNLALIHKNRPIIGIIYAPYFDLLYYAILNHGAYKIEKNSEPIKIHSNTISTIKAKPLIIATSRRHHKLSKYNNFINYLNSNNIVYNTVVSGSAIKFGLVAEGKADLYPRFGLTSEWDSAAGDCIVSEAGGIVNSTCGHRLDYNTKESLLNPEFYAAGDSNFDWIKIFKTHVY